MKSNLEAIKKLLLDRKIILEQELTRLSQEKFSDDQVQDPGDQALSSTMESLKVSLQDTERGEYNRINQALEKIEDGTYGICSDCGQPISETPPLPNVRRQVAGMPGHACMQDKAR